MDYHLFEGTENEQTVNTEDNYDIRVNCVELRVGCEYTIRIAGCQMHYGDSDEHTEAVSGTANGYSIAIGSYDPNDDEKLDQAYEYTEKLGDLAGNMIICPPKYDESRFERYDVDMLEDYSGFRFHLIDGSERKLYFSIAWIKNELSDPSEYEAAVGFWTT